MDPSEPGVDGLAWRMAGRNEHAQGNGPTDDGAGGLGVTAVHWCAPDIPRDILAAAWSPDLPPPTAIHVRPELHARMLAAVPSPRTGGESAPSGPDVPLVVDDRIPVSPGYEIHRCA